MTDRCMRTDSTHCDPSRISLNLWSQVIWLGSQLMESFLIHLSIIWFSLSIRPLLPSSVKMHQTIAPSSVYMHQTITPPSVYMHQIITPSSIYMHQTIVPLPSEGVNVHPISSTI